MSDPSATKEPVLAVQDLSASYGNVKALAGVSFSIERGAVLAVLGTNGAGKSTLARSLAGLVPHGGRIYLAGKDVSEAPPHRRRCEGLVYLPEQRGVFPDLSVLDNLRMSVRPERQKAERQRSLEATLDMFPVLAQRKSQIAGTLSGGEQQMLALAGALSTGPQVLVGDELSVGLAPRIVDALFDTFVKAKQAGKVIVVIEQYVHRALELADSAIILKRGQVVWAGQAGSARDEVLRHYLEDSAELAVESNGRQVFEAAPGMGRTL
jgi:branched-chain amino acid transport system ATP-binding protein